MYYIYSSSHVIHELGYIPVLHVHNMCITACIYTSYVPHVYYMNYTKTTYTYRRCNTRVTHLLVHISWPFSGYNITFFVGIVI